MSRLRNGQRRRLNCTISLFPYDWKEGEVKKDGPIIHYNFRAGTIVTVRHNRYEVSRKSYVKSTVTLVRVETDEGRVIHAFRTELDAITEDDHV
jgi:hypothetical protein